MKERVDVSLPASESVTAQITDPETVVENTDMQKGDGAANVLQSDLRWDGVETEAEQSQFKVPTKRKKAGDFQVVRAKKADVEDAYCDDGMESGKQYFQSNMRSGQGSWFYQGNAKKFITGRHHVVAADISVWTVIPSQSVSAQASDHMDVTSWSFMFC
ncbi:hypothetical protein ROHU_026185 [Labeo rohita]|uniref:Uncharacterized protein n=1 Tax=Labeo rohita TaxID=84645 RepID=A0A498MNA6_LABRO|nr:hypothetical protein ROHU_026185 [Labeo rohita]